MTLALPPQLTDGTIALVPLSEEDVDDMLALAGDEDVIAFTLVRAGAGRAYIEDWIGRYEQGRHDGSRAGFSIRDARDRSFLGFAAVVRMQLAEREGELGYMVTPSARGRGIAARAVELLGRWCFDELGLERLELRIDPANAASVRVAERTGYTLEGVLRNVHFKDGLRTDVGIWVRHRDPKRVR